MSPRSRWQRIAPLALVAVGAAGVVWCLTDPYRGRVALMDSGRLTRPEDVNWSPAEAPGWNRFDPPHVLEPLVPLAREQAGSGTTRERALNLLRYVAALGGPNAAVRTDVDRIDTDDPLLIMKQVSDGSYVPNCAHYAVILHELLQAAGMPARMVGLDGEGWLDGRGHAFNEVWLPETGTWMLLDPRYHAWFEDASGRPLSTLELRERLLAGEDVLLQQGAILPDPLPRDSLIRSYRRGASRVLYVGVNNLLEARTAIYESALANAVRLERWPRQLRRVLENVIWSLDRRYLYIDRPEIEEHFVPWYALRAALVLMAIGGVWWAAGRWFSGSPVRRSLSYSGS